MAKVTYQGLNSYISQCVELRNKAVPACKYTLFEMAGVYADSIRASVEAHSLSGGLAKSLDITPMFEKDGVVEVYIGFSGYDDRGVPNPLKANILESGTSNGHVKKTHFFTNAIKAAKAKAEASATSAFDEFVSHIVKE